MAVQHLNKLYDDLEETKMFDRISHLMELPTSNHALAKHYDNLVMKLLLSAESSMPTSSSYNFIPDLQAQGTPVRMLKFNLFSLKTSKKYDKQIFSIFKQCDIIIQFPDTIHSTQKLLSQAMHSLRKVQMQHNTLGTQHIQQQNEDLLVED